MITSPDQSAPVQVPTESSIASREYCLRYGACYIYSPKGESDASQRSRLLCARVKNGSSKWLKSYVARLRHEVVQQRLFGDFFKQQTLLVPIPQCSSPIRAPLWVARRLAFALQAAGLGEEVWMGLRRVGALERSSTAWMWQRPTVQQHYQSLALIPSSKRPAEVVLVDDVITKGRTLVAAAIRMHEAFPAASIRAFALVRTMGFVRDVDRLFDPCEGAITWNGRDAYRDP